MWIQGVENSSWSVRSFIAEGFARGSIVTTCIPLQTETWSDQSVFEQHGRLNTVASFFFLVLLSISRQNEAISLLKMKTQGQKVWMKGERTPTEMQVDSDVTQANSRSEQSASAKSQPGRRHADGNRQAGWRDDWNASVRGTDGKMLVDIRSDVAVHLIVVGDSWLSQALQWPLLW